MSVRNFFGNMLAGFKRHAPAWLTAGGIGLMLTGTVLAVKATPEAMRRIEEMKEEEDHDELTVLQTIQATWRCYIWAAAVEIGGASCMIGALKEGEKRLSAAMAVADAGQNLLREFQDYRRFMQERIGEKKEAEVYNMAAQPAVDRNPPPADMDKEFIDGQAPKPVCYHKAYERYFYCDYETVKAAVNKLNYEINNGLNGYVSLNDFYDEIRVETSEFGDMVGWSTETGLIEIPDKESLRYAGTSKGWPCWVLEFTNPPQYEYQFFRKH